MSRSPFETPYARYDVLAKRASESWDDVTRRAVDARLERVPRREFFSPGEWQTLEAVCARLLPQPERGVPIPIVPWIDAKLRTQPTEGYRFEGMPPARDAYRKALCGLEQDAQLWFGLPFSALSDDTQDALLRNVQHGTVRGEAWRGMSAASFFSNLLLSDAISVYYAHPEAWNEIGFGGPASPRGYVRLQISERDPWEAVAQDERRDREP